MRFTLILFIFLATLPSKAQQPIKRYVSLMGCDFDITVVAENPAEGNRYIDLAIEEIRRIESLISSWDPDSQTSAINRNAGVQPVQVDKELFDLIRRAMDISRLTDGAFDITYASMDKIWKFDGSVTEMPDPALINTSIKKIGFQNIILNPDKNTVFLPQKGMKIGFGAIGKGYAADRAKALLQKQGVKAGIINASGDMNTWGQRSADEPWTVAITNPMDKTKSYGTLPVIEKAVVTSGNYEKYVMIDGKRNAHIIDPRTGYPASGILSVTVFAPKAELADALATTVFVMGIDIGLHRINQIPEVDCIIIDDKGKIHQSNNIKINFYD